MKSSIVGFKVKSADLHKKSPKIFLMSLIFSILFTFILITISIPYKSSFEKRIDVLPVIIHVENIPETRHAMRLSAPPKPFISSGTPIEIDDELLPDDITIEDTKLDFDAFPEVSPSNIMPGAGAADEETEIFEFFAVEEIPKRINDVIPEYPEMAKRAGIEGSVTLKVLVNENGDVDSVNVEEGHNIFRKSAIEAAKAAKFAPAKFNNKAVKCWVLMRFRFVMEE